MIRKQLRKRVRNIVALAAAALLIFGTHQVPAFAASYLWWLIGGGIAIAAVIGAVVWWLHKHETVWFSEDAFEFIRLHGTGPVDQGAFHDFLREKERQRAQERGPLALTAAPGGQGDASTQS